MRICKLTVIIAGLAGSLQLACGTDPVDEAYAASGHAALARSCATQRCQPVSDHDTDSGEGSGIGTSSTAAKDLAHANAIQDARNKATAKVVIPSCASGCKPFGAPNFTYEDFPGGCAWVGEYDDWSDGQPDNNPNDGIGDWWAYACHNTDGRSIHERCDVLATAQAKPFGATCYANSIATGTQLCVDEDCLCSSEEGRSTGQCDDVVVVASDAQSADVHEAPAEP